MKVINIAAGEFSYDAEDPDGFRSGMQRLGPALGTSQTGMSVYELPPGQSICPFHYEYAEEEWLMVLEGTPLVRHADGETRMQAWDVTAFTPGPSGAHRVHNDTDANVRVLMFSDVKMPAATVYPDSDKIGIWTGNKDDSMLAYRSSRVEYYDGEV